MRKLLWIFLALLFLAGVAHGQGVRFGDGQPIFSAQVSGGPVYSVPLATISFCGFPANAVPCTNKAVTYTDITLATACPSNQQITLAGTASCVTKTDLFGNWGVWVATGNYSYTIQLPGGGYLGPYAVTLQTGGGGGGTTLPASPGLSAQFSNAGVTSFATAGLTVDAIPATKLLWPNLLFTGQGTNYFQDTGVANAYVITTPFAFTSLTKGWWGIFTAVNANTGPSTIAVDTAAACTLTKNGGPGGGSALIANDIKAGQQIMFTFDGTNCEMQSLLGNPATGSITNPAGSDTQIQFNKSGAFGASSGLSVDNSTTPATFINSLDFEPKGANPYIDIRAYGARAVSTSTAAVCTGGNATLPVTSGAGFVNGDGITVLGCGATNTMTNPAAGPTVTPAVSTGPTNTGYTAASVTGSTTYQYQYSAIDKNGGVTAASPVTSISTGQATLGQNTATVSTWTRANNVTTENTSASTPLATGAVICMTGASDPGCMLVASTPTGSQFTIQTGADTRSGAAASGSGGTVNFYLSNHLTAAAVTGAFSYCWYGRTNGSMAFIGQSRPGELTFDDYGSVFSSPPANSKCPATPPGSATNDDLTTTIASGAPTNNLVLTVAPTNSNASSTALYDAAPSILSAAQVAAQGGGSSSAPGVLYIPCMGNGGGFTTNSYLDLSGLNRLHIRQAGSLTLNNTLAIGGFLTWDGEPGCSSSTTSFAKALTASISVGSAWPGIYETGSTNSQTIYFTKIQLGIPNQGLGFVSSSGSGFWTTFDTGNCSVGSGGNNYTGMCIVTYGNAQYRTINFNVIASTPAGLYSTLTPGIFARNDTGNTVPPAAWTFDNTVFTHNGFAAVANPAIGGAQFYTIKSGYSQGMIMPNFVIEMGNEAATIHDIGFVPDTTSAPIFTNLGTTNLTADFQGMSAASVVQTSGSPMALHIQSSSVAQLGQSTGYSQESSSTIAGQSPWNTANLTLYPYYNFSEQVIFTGGHSAYIPLAAPSGGAVAVSAGGSVPIGTENYTVAGRAVDGGIGTQTAVLPCVTTTGNQTCTVTWNALLGATNYYVTRNGVAVTACENITALSCADSTGGVDGSVRLGAVAGGGITSMTPAGLFGGQLVLSSPLGGGNTSFKGTFVPGTLTANRTYTTPDATGTLMLTTTPSVPINLGCPFVIKSGNYTLTSNDCILTFTSGATVTIPHALTGLRWLVSNTQASGTITLQMDSGTINGAASLIVAANSEAEISVDGTNGQALVAGSGGGGGGSGTVSNCTTAGAFFLAPGVGTTATCTTDLIDTAIGSGYLSSAINVSAPSLAGTASTSGGTYNVGNLACVTASNTIGDCGSAAANQNYVGVILAKNSAAPEYATEGTVLANSQASATWTANDLVCTDSSNAAKMVDGGSTFCEPPQIQVGIVKVTDGGSVTQHTITLARAGAGAALPLTGGGANTLACTITSAAQGQVLGFNGTPICVNLYSGVNVDLQTGAYTLLCPTDRLGEVNFNLTSGAATLTIPQAGSNSCFSSNIAFVIRNSVSSTSILTLSPTTSVFQPENKATYTVLPGAATFIYSDNTNYYAIPIPRFQGTVSKHTASYTMSELDDGVLTVMNCSSACTLTFPAAPPTPHWTANAITIGSTTASTSLNALTLNGAATAPTLNSTNVLHWYTDGTNYFGDVSVTGGGGSGTVNAGLTGQMAYYPGNAATVSGNANVNISNGALSLGVANTTIGSLKVFGNTSGAVTILPQAAAGTYNFNLPTSAGTSGQILQSGGGGATAMSFTSALANGTTATTQTGGDNSTNISTTAYVDAHFIANGTSAMGTSAISSGACATVVTTTATGTATTDVISFTPNTDPTAVTGYAPSSSGSLYIWAYPTANNVNFKVCNNTTSSITPSALTLNWKVTR